MSKVKIEKIDVNDNYTYPVRTKKSLPREKLYKEKTIVRKREISIDENLSSTDKVNKISSDIDILNKRYVELRRKYLHVKLFSPARYDINNTFNHDFSSFENYLKKFGNDLMLVSKYFASFRVKYDETSNTINEIIEEVYRLFDFSSGLNDDIEAIKKKYFGEFKVTTHALIKDKSIDQIEDLIIRVDTELASYKTLEEANDYIIYNSGKLIIDVVNGIVSSKKKVKGDISYRFFLQNDDIISFDLEEWIRLFVRINYVREKMKDDIIFSSSLLEKYRLLEAKYAIVIIYSEKRRTK